MPARRFLIAGNWKMHLGAAEAATFCERLVASALPATVDVVVCPPFVSLPAAAMVLSGSAVGLGGQNVHWESHGAFTGEISAPMLSELGVGWVIVGHSERRTLFGDSDASAARRARAAQDHGLKVIYCLGESLAERESGATFSVLDRQLAVVPGLDPERLVIAYEPVWAIGTGRNASAEQAQEAHRHLRDRLTESVGSAAADALRILYGGSLKPGTALELLRQPDVDGGLIGGASLDVSDFSSIIAAAAECADGVGV